MSMKEWFGKRGGGKKKPGPVHVDDLIILEKWDEAERMLKDNLKRKSRDLSSRTKLAKIYEKTSRPREAVEEYIYIADRYAVDGHFDKASAMLSKANKMAPQEGKIILKRQAVERMRKFEQRLSSVMRSLSSLEGQVGSTATSSYLELRRVWSELAVSDLMNHLDNEQLGRLLKVMELQRLGRDKAIVERGQQLDQLFLVTRGKVDIELELPNGETTVIRCLEPGDVVGDQALLERSVWKATYRTTEPVVLLVLDRPGLEAALQGNTDPRGLLNALREQRLDLEVAEAVRKTLQT